jgi:hypothetical protein
MTNSIVIKEIAPDFTSLVATSLPRIDYRDALTAEVATQQFHNVDAFAQTFFRQQPAWLRLVSIGVARRGKLEQILAKTVLEPGQKIGSWKIFQRNQNEIVFGEEMVFMSYRFSLSLFPQEIADRIGSATVVQLHGKLGKVYFGLVKILHLRFIKLSLKNTLKVRNIRS